MSVSQLSGWSVWRNGQHIVSATEYTAPAMSIEKTPWRAGAMDGARQMDTGIGELTARLRVQGSAEDIGLSLGFRLLHRTRLSIREGYRNPGGSYTRTVDNIEGWVSGIQPDPSGSTGRAGKSTVLDITCEFFERTVDGREALLLIPGLGVRRINGIDTQTLITAGVLLASLDDPWTGSTWKPVLHLE